MNLIHGTVILSYIMNTFCYMNMINFDSMTAFDLKLKENRFTYISCSSDFALDHEDYSMNEQDFFG